MRHLLLPIALLACALATPAFATGMPAEPSKKLCKKDVVKCQKMKNQREEYCQRNPAECGRPAGRAEEPKEQGRSKLEPAERTSGPPR